MNGFLSKEVVNAGSFAQFFNRTDFRTSASHDIGTEDGMGRPFDVICGDLLDEFWNVNTGGTAFRAWRIITEQTAVGFDQRRLLRFKRRMNITEILSVFFSGQFIVRYSHDSNYEFGLTIPIAIGRMRNLTALRSEFNKFAVGFGTTIAVELPCIPNFIDHIKIKFSHEQFILVL